METVLQNINKLNRSLEGVIAVWSPVYSYSMSKRGEIDWELQVGNEFSQVEGLWSQFENVMAKPSTSSSAGAEKGELKGEGEAV